MNELFYTEDFHLMEQYSKIG